MSIRSDLKTLLKERKLSQKDFADLAGINQSALSRFLHTDGVSIAERIVPYIYGDKNPLVRPSEEKASQK